MIDIDAILKPFYPRQMDGSGKTPYDELLDVIDQLLAENKRLELALLNSTEAIKVQLYDIFGVDYCLDEPEPVLEAAKKMKEENERLKSELDEITNACSCREAEFARWKDRAERAEAKVADWLNSMTKVLTPCLDDDHEHCSCVPLLQKRVAELEAENFALCAGICEHLIGDDRGHPTCKYREELYSLKNVKESNVKESYEEVTFFTLDNPKPRKVWILKGEPE